MHEKRELASSLSEGEPYFSQEILRIFAASGPLLNEIMDLKGRLDAEQLSAAEALEDALRLRKLLGMHFSGFQHDRFISFDEFFLDQATARIGELEQEVAKERANFHEEEMRRANEALQHTSEAERCHRFQNQSSD